MRKHHTGLSSAEIIKLRTAAEGSCCDQSYHISTVLGKLDMVLLIASTRWCSFAVTVFSQSFQHLMIHYLELNIQRTKTQDSYQNMASRTSSTRNWIRRVSSDLSSASLMRAALVIESPG
jgi:hypothetical protein